MVLVGLAPQLMKRLEDNELCFLFVCIAAFCLGFVYISPSLFYRNVIGYRTDVNCGALGHF